MTMETIMPKEPGKLDTIENICILFGMGCLLLCVLCAAFADYNASWGIYSIEKFISVSINGFINNPFFPLMMLFLLVGSAIMIVKAAISTLTM
jgi:hypothetical protein